jgi:biotin synthase
MSSTDTSVERVARAHVEGLFERPLLELVHAAAVVHRQHHAADRVQCSQLLSIKTGGCPENCGYCSQSVHHGGEVAREPLLDVDAVLATARQARDGGADRFCMGAAWRQVKDGPEFDRVLRMVQGVKALGLESCVTLGMLQPEQARRLKDAGLDYYNHNLDTGRSHYANVVTTRCYDDRLTTLANVRSAGLKTCCGGIVGLGESRAARAELLWQLANLPAAPTSVPINALVPIPGTPLGDQPLLDWTEIVRAVAVARLVMPESIVRLSAGRSEMHEAAQALCFLAGANSIFLGDELLTTPNPSPQSDAAMLGKLGLQLLQSSRA